MLDNNIFQSSSSESSAPILYFVKLAEFLINVIPLVISDFYTMIYLYILRLAIVKSVKALGKEEILIQIRVIIFIHMELSSINGNS